MGDSAFVMYNNKAVPILMGVHYSDRYAGEITCYSVNISTGNGLERFKEKEVFKTKKELESYEIEDKDKRNNRRLYA